VADLEIVVSRRLTVCGEFNTSGLWRLEVLGFVRV